MIVIYGLLILKLGREAHLEASGAVGMGLEN